jgi:hypothetical protein
MDIQTVDILSENLATTKEGFLVAKNVKIATVEPLEYIIDGDVVLCEKPADELLSDETMASFEGKPITLEHPDEFIKAENWASYAVGYLSNITHDDKYLIADLIIQDKKAIDAVLADGIREVSIGIDAQIDKTVTPMKYYGIKGNHLAIVKEGRAGEVCSIIDEKGGVMSKEKEVLTAETVSVDKSFFDRLMTKVLGDKEVQAKDAESVESAVDVAVFDEFKAMVEAKFAEYEAKIKELEDKMASDSTQEQAVTDTVEKVTDSLPRANMQTKPNFASIADIQRQIKEKK